MDPKGRDAIPEKTGIPFTSSICVSLHVEKVCTLGTNRVETEIVELKDDQIYSAQSTLELV